MDHIVIAIHHEAASNLLPYNVSVNGGNRHCFHGPPVFQTGIAGALYKGHILRLETLTAGDRMNKNPSHECAGVSPAVNVCNTVSGEMTGGHDARAAAT